MENETTNLWTDEAIKFAKEKKLMCLQQLLNGVNEWLYEFHDELKEADDALQDIARIAEQKISDIKKYKNETYSADAVVEYSERILDIVRKATNKKGQTNER